MNYDVDTFSPEQAELLQLMKQEIRDSLVLSRVLYLLEGLLFEIDPDWESRIFSAEKERELAVCLAALDYARNQST